MTAEQIEPISITLEAIMKDPAFWAGIADQRAGRPYPRFTPNARDEWSYDRGRLFAVIAPRDMRIMIKGRINPLALQLFRVHHESRDIL